MAEGPPVIAKGIRICHLFTNACYQESWEQVFVFRTCHSSSSQVFFGVFFVIPSGWFPWEQRPCMCCWLQQHGSSNQTQLPVLDEDEMSEGWVWNAMIGGLSSPAQTLLCPPGPHRSRPVPLREWWSVPHWPRRGFAGCRWRHLWGWGDHRLHILLWRGFLLDRCILWASQDRGGVWEWGNGHRDATGSWATIGRGARGSVFLSAQRVDPAGAVLGGEGAQGQRGEPHVLPRGDQLAKSFLVGKGIAGPPGPVASAQATLRHAAGPAPGAPHATAPRLMLLLPHQLSVAYLEKDGTQQMTGRIVLRKAES